MSLNAVNLIRISKLCIFIQCILFGYLMAMLSWGSKICIEKGNWLQSSCTYIPEINISILWIGIFFFTLMIIEYLTGVNNAKR